MEDTAAHRTGDVGTDALPALTFGTFAALVLLLVHRWGLAASTDARGWEPFVSSFLASAAFAGAALSVTGLFRGDPKPRPAPPALRVAAVAPLAAGVALSEICAGACGALAAGVLSGLGCALCSAVLAKHHALLKATTLLPTLGLSLMCAAAVTLGAALSPAAAQPALTVTLTAVFAALLVACRPKGDAGSGCGNPSRLPRRLVELAEATWMPVSGAAICLFVFGFTWDVEALGVQLNDDGLVALEKVVGLALAASVLLAVARLRHRVDTMTVLMGAVLPVLVVTFVVRPYFIGASLGPAALMLIGVARETGFILFVAVSWLALANQSRLCGVRAEIPMGAYLALLGVSGTVGLSALPAAGTSASYMGAILFTCYLVATNMVSALSRSPEPQEGTGGAAGEGVEAFVERRCSELGIEFGFTARERDVAMLLGRGHSYAYIANALTVSENTVRTHARNMYRKAGVSSREELLDLVHRAPSGRSGPEPPR